MQSIEDIKILTDDFANLARLAAGESADDVRLFLAKLVRKYRTKDQAFAESLQQALKATATRSAEPSVLRRGPMSPAAAADLPVDQETRQSLIRVFNDLDGLGAPLLPTELLTQLQAIVHERLERNKLLAAGIAPTRSAILVGPPGVGKSLSARWLAASLGKPLWVLDLTTVMSSLLGKTGTNLRAVFDHAKANEAVLLLDEIDAIAKRRSDESDVGELKRLVAGILQEVDGWPDSGLLLAATNHPELVDPALWRRFDAVLHFDAPTRQQLEDGIRRFLGPQADLFDPFVSMLAETYGSQSLSDVERSINALRRQVALNGNPVQAAIEWTVAHVGKLDKPGRLALAIQMAKSTDLSHNRIHEITGVARDTIRKHAGPSPIKGRAGRKEQ
jgi:anti-sigma factor RsiW